MFFFFKRKQKQQQQLTNIGFVINYNYRTFGMFFFLDKFATKNHNLRMLGNFTTTTIDWFVRLFLFNPIDWKCVRFGPMSKLKIKIREKKMKRKSAMCMSSIGRRWMRLYHCYRKFLKCKKKNNQERVQENYHWCCYLTKCEKLTPFSFYHHQDWRNWIK